MSQLLKHFDIRIFLVTHTGMNVHNLFFKAIRGSKLCFLKISNGFYMKANRINY